MLLRRAGAQSCPLGWSNFKFTDVVIKKFVLGFKTLNFLLFYKHLLLIFLQNPRLNAISIHGKTVLWIKTMHSLVDCCLSSTFLQSLRGKRTKTKHFIWVLKQLRFL